MKSLGQWHGSKFYFGLHHDWHAGKKAAQLGARGNPRELAALLKVAGVDFVQCDCKGHPGHTSWFSRTPTASVPEDLKRDALADWRKATKSLGLPLHCHYSGIWDNAAGARHPSWAVVGPDGGPAGAPFGAQADARTNNRMCPRGPYLRKLLIPQMLELIDRYQVDGFWVDGEAWAVQPCYCKACRKAFTQQTGIETPPTDRDDSNWVAWWNFTRESFEEYVTAYCDAVHEHKKGVLVCSNWLQTFRNPGPPTVPTDWISGDNMWVWGLDGSRCEARFLSTRNKPWDIMLWNFYKSHDMQAADSPWTTKPVQMLMQEAAVLLSFGGNVQVYQQCGRDGRLVPWQMKRLRTVGRFVKRRRRVCQGTQTMPQLAVLHSEHHVRGTPQAGDLLSSMDTQPVQGAVFAMLENHFGVDVLDEWALLPRLAEFPVVVAPERNRMSDAMAEALQRYVRQGGKLVVSGADALEGFDPDFLGIAAGEQRERCAFYVPAGDGRFPLYSEAWKLVSPTTARTLAQLSSGPRTDDGLLPHPAATLNRVGKGAVLYIPCNIFRDFEHNRYPAIRAFIGDMTRKLAGRLDIAIKAPVCVDAALRRKGRRRIVHLVNRASGIPNLPNNGVIDEIPMVGPIEITIRMPGPPRAVTAAFEKGKLTHHYRNGKLHVMLDRLHIHEAVIVEE